MQRRRNSALLGVCGGIADHYGIDVLYVRLAFAIAFLGYGLGIGVYLLLWFLMD